jgi:hypothetical protein
MRELTPNETPTNIPELTLEEVEFVSGGKQQRQPPIGTILHPCPGMVTVGIPFDGRVTICAGMVS